MVLAPRKSDCGEFSGFVLLFLFLPGFFVPSTLFIMCVCCVSDEDGFNSSLAQIQCSILINAAGIIVKMPRFMSLENTVLGSKLGERHSGKKCGALAAVGSLLVLSLYLAMTAGDLR